VMTANSPSAEDEEPEDKQLAPAANVSAKLKRGRGPD